MATYLLVSLNPHDLLHRAEKSNYVRLRRAIYIIVALIQAKFLMLQHLAGSTCLVVRDALSQNS